MADWATRHSISELVKTVKDLTEIIRRLNARIAALERAAK